MQKRADRAWKWGGCCRGPPRRDDSFREPVPRLRDRFEGACSIVCTFSYFGFHWNVARRRGDNSCALEQIWSRTSTTCPKTHETCTNCDGQAWYRFLNRTTARKNALELRNWKALAADGQAWDISQVKIPLLLQGESRVLLMNRDAFGFRHSRQKSIASDVTSEPSRVADTSDPRAALVKFAEITI